MKNAYWQKDFFTYLFKLQKIHMRIIFIGFVFLLHNSQAQNSLDVQHILDKYYNAVGGLVAWKNINSISIKSSSKYYEEVNANPLKSTEKKIFKRPHYFYLESPGNKWVSDGSKLYRSSNAAALFESENEIQEASDMMTKSMTREFNYGVTDILIHCKSFEFKGIQDFHGEDLYVVKAVTEYNLELLFFFNLKDFLLKAYGPTDLKYYTIIDEYKKIKGILVPYKERGFAKNKLVGETQLIELVINVNIPDSFFNVNSLTKTK